MSAKLPSDPPEGPVSSERLVEAISPVLAAELARILEEFRSTLEAEANVRLRKAVLDKEAEFKVRLEAEARRVREETSTEVRREVIAELEGRFKQDLAAELETQKSRFDAQAKDAAERWKQERIGLVSEAERWRVLAEFERRVGDAGTQMEILRRFLGAAARFAAGVALYLNKADGLAVWKAEGESAAFPDLVSEETIDPEWYFAAVVVRGKTVAAACAAGVEDRESLDILVEALKRAIENLGLRIRFLGREAAAPAEPVPASPPASPAPSKAESPEDSAEFRADARRLARMLVSEIKLGNEKEVLEGRAHSDLYARLQRQIESGRDAYHRQIPSTGSGHDYFHEELVKILADNDPRRMGEGYPGVN